MTQIDISNPEIFFDRELSWVDFNNRVLEEAQNQSNPLLERLKFLCITETNLDEFFMVRVAGLLNVRQSGAEERSLSGHSTSEILQTLSKKVSEFVNTQYATLGEIMGQLRNEGIIIQNSEELTADEIKLVRDYYKKDVSSILTPLAIDTSHPFPHILNKTLNLAILLTSDDDKSKREIFAVVQVPSVLPRFLALPDRGEEKRFFPLEEIIKLHLSDLFHGMKVKEIHPFRIIRDADISINEEETASDLLTSMKNELKNRMWGDAIRLDLMKGSGRIREVLKELLELQEYQLYEVDGPLNLNDLMYFYNLDKTSTANLKFTFPQPKAGFYGKSIDNIFQSIRKGDKLLHHPYESFKSIEDMLKKASADNKVLAIKMTLYRTSGDSPIIQYLSEAAENGKQVTVLVELKARFDEERNIRWAKKLEDSGVHVVYGVVGLKIHCKMLLIVRKEDDKLNRYVHLGTGNYNSTTARFYTDLSLFTNNTEITEEVALLFNVITSNAKMPQTNHIYAAPLYLKEKFIELIEEEASFALSGKKAHIIFKMNSLVDPDIIISLYKASQAGVQIDLIIRGICCLKPGIPGISENIRVRSIIGRYLEHSRVYYFGNNGKSKYFLASADCMPRNFLRRIEVMFPILEEKNREKIDKILQLQLTDNTSARVLQADGNYVKLEPVNDEPAINAQVDMANL
ncbi:polyphosphate kinase 1 [Leptospira sp. GIMC2001]|uniref:polyphosphate kinase 1 n=1 Tax=Leptospira sp. GIMC2001 TaxID=1513297 RepID=UPI00234BE2D9|nr:polyphosphate kinase 1 [Leptospira sp. GIMC2001]WCL48803.1 polyphosphate kinase 1 [Leptospira sp. GIMC2001]